MYAASPHLSNMHSRHILVGRLELTMKPVAKLVKCISTGTIMDAVTEPTMACMQAESVSVGSS